MSLQSVTITALNQSNDPIEGAKISLTSYNSGALFGTQTTDASGDATFDLCVEPGIVLITFEHRGCVSVDQTSVIVANNNVDAEDYTPQVFTIHKTLLELEADTPLESSCLIFGTVLRQNGPHENTPVILSTIGQNRSGQVGVGGDSLALNPLSLSVANSRQEVRTDVNGYWEIKALPGTYARLEIPSHRYAVDFRVPNKTSLHFGDIRPWSVGSANPNTGSPFGSGQ